MSYDTYRLIFIGAAIACGVMFLVSVTLFFVFKIPNIIGNLTGRNAKKAIEDIKRQNESYVYSDKTNANALNCKKKITEKISTARLDNVDETTVLGDNGTDETMVLGNNGTDETTVLGNNGTDETTVLGNNGTDETILLGYSGELPKQMVRDAAFAVTEEIRFIHTNEWI